jgi:hypothetical protein
VFFAISWILAIISSTETETLSTFRLICSEPDETTLAWRDVSSALEIIWRLTDERSCDAVASVTGLEPDLRREIPARRALRRPPGLFDRADDVTGEEEPHGDRDAGDQESDHGDQRRALRRERHGGALLFRVLGRRELDHFQDRLPVLLVERLQDRVGERLCGLPISAPHRRDELLVPNPEELLGRLVGAKQDRVVHRARREQLLPVLVALLEVRPELLRLLDQLLEPPAVRFVDHLVDGQERLDEELGGRNDVRDQVLAQRDLLVPRTGDLELVERDGGDDAEEDEPRQR